MQFADTRWSIVIRAGLDTEDGRAALASLCEAYVGPLNEFLRRCGYGADRAAEFTQSFFLKLIDHNFVRSADQSKGRFRTFLLTALRRSVSNDLREQSRVKRGGHLQFVSLEGAFTSSDPEATASVLLSPDRQFDRDWALNVLDRAIDALEDRYAFEEKNAIFETLKSTLTYDWEAAEREAACDRLKITRPHLRVIISRFRADFRVALRRVVLDTVTDPADVDDEIQELMMALSGR